MKHSPVTICSLNIHTLNGWTSNPGVYRRNGLSPKPLSVGDFCCKKGHFCPSCQKHSTTTAHLYTGCPRRNGQNFGRVFLMLNYTDITQNTYIQSLTVTEIMAREVWNFDSCYSLIIKYILKLAGICGFCNVNICTYHQSNLWVT